MKLLISFWKLTCLFSITHITDKMVRGQMEAFSGGLCILSDSDVVLQHNTHYMDCVNECRSRRFCVSISVHPRAKICRMHQEEDDVEPMTNDTCQGYVFSRKETWIQKTIPGCESCLVTEACVKDNAGNAHCAHKECRPAPPIDNGTVYGNGNRSIGSKISYVCDLNFKGNLVRRCQTDGQWSGTIPTCLQYVFDLPFKNGDPDFGQFNLTANGISFVENDSLTFQVRADVGDLHMLLRTGSTSNPEKIFKVVIGGWENNGSVIVKPPDEDFGSFLDEHWEYESGIFSAVEFRYFWISINPHIKVGKGSIVGQNTILDCPECACDPPLQYLQIGVGHGNAAVVVFP